MGYFPEDAMKHINHREPTSLEGIVAQFPPNLKQAMYSAATKGAGLASSRWGREGNGKPGCAFHEAGRAADPNISITSITTAAAVFGISEGLVQRFITTWDGMHIATETGRANMLKQILLDVGVTTPIAEIDHANDSVVVISDVVYKGTQTQFVEALEKVDTIVDLGFDVDEAVAADDLVSLLVPT